MELKYKNGKATIRKGRKIVAKIFNRPVFFKGTKYEGKFKTYPFNLEILNGPGSWSRQCKDEAEAIHYLHKYVANGTEKE